MIASFIAGILLIIALALAIEVARALLTEPEPQRVSYSGVGLNEAALTGYNYSNPDLVERIRLCIKRYSPRS